MIKKLISDLYWLSMKIIKSSMNSFASTVRGLVGWDKNNFLKNLVSSSFSAFLLKLWMVINNCTQVIPISFLLGFYVTQVTNFFYNFLHFIFWFWIFFKWPNCDDAMVMDTTHLCLILREFLLLWICKSIQLIGQSK